MRFIDLFKRWKLIQQGWSSGKKRRQLPQSPLEGVLNQSLLLKLFIFLFFTFALALLFHQSESQSFYKTQDPSPVLILVFLITSIGMNLYFSGEKHLTKSSNLVLFLGGVSLHLLLIHIVHRLVAQNEIDPSYRFLLLPFSFAPMIHSILLGRRAGIISVFSVSFLGLLFMHSETALVYLVTSLVCGFLVISMTHVVRKRSRLLQTGLYVGILVLILAYCFNVICFNNLLTGHYETWQTFLIRSFSVFSIGWITAMIINGLLPFIEDLFALTTDISWLEQSDLNHKLMKRMQLQAPGTFQHSLAVASLSEAAAEAIGANAIMCRACSYFHDIGKLEKPAYFIENQNPDHNPHDELTPTMSALVIIAHVKDGVDLALRHKLNPKIIEIIQEHHGDSLTYYFYHKAQTQKAQSLQDESGELPNIETKNFRYPGPRPQSKESAIISLADTVESASRSLKKPTPRKIQDLVEDLVKNRLSQGQLDDCSLTLTEINILKRSFSKSLRSMMHSRIDYPQKDQAKKNSAKQDDQQDQKQ